MNLLQLKYFCHAAKTENFSKTAQHFLVPPSNISQTVKRLERELGVSLFDRENNKLTLNSSGREFYEKISTALNMIDDAVFELSEVTGEMKGKIRLLVSTNRRIVTAAIERFKIAYPRVSFLIDHIGKEREYDVIISDDLSLCRGYTATPIITEQILLAISSENPLSRLEFVTAGELEKEKFVMMNEDSSLSHISLDICHRLGFEPNIAIRIDDPYYLRKYVELNLGVALVPSVSWKNQFDSSIIFKSLGDFTRTTYAFVKKDRYLSASVKAFLDELYKHTV